MDLCTAEGAVNFKPLMPVVCTNVFLGIQPRRSGTRKPVIINFASIILQDIYSIHSNYNIYNKYCAMSWK